MKRIVTFLFVVGVLGSSPALAHEDHKGGHPKEHGEGHEQAKAKAASDTRALHEIWAGVRAKLSDLDAVIEAQKWPTVHYAAFAVRDEVQALAKRSAHLDKKAKAKLDAYAKQVAKMAADLDAAGDSNNEEGVLSLQPKFRSLIEKIQGLYPKDQLTPKKQSEKKGSAEHGHEHKH